MLLSLFLWLIAVNVHAAEAYESLSQVPNHLYPFGPEDDQNPVDFAYLDMNYGPHMRHILPKKKPMKFLGHKVIEIMEEEGGGILLYNVTHQIIYNGFHAPLFNRLTEVGKVFPFSSNINLNMGGHITYRFVDKKTDRRLLKKATRDVRKAFPCNQDFTPKAVIIITWYNVNFFQQDWEDAWYKNGDYCDFYVNEYCCSDSWEHYDFFCGRKRSVEVDDQGMLEQTVLHQGGLPERRAREAEFEDNRKEVDYIDTTLGLNTFQTVFIYNKYHTYVMFNYGEINWNRGARAFIQSDGVNYTLPVSGTEEMRNIEENTNCGVQGRYMFRVDSATGVKLPSDC